MIDSENQNITESIQLLNKDLKKLKEQILIKQNNKCRICGCEITPETGCHLDHNHLIFNFSSLIHVFFPFSLKISPVSDLKAFLNNNSGYCLFSKRKTLK